MSDSTYNQVAESSMSVSELSDVAQQILDDFSEHSPDLDSELVIMPVDSSRVHAYWSVNSETLLRAQQRSSSQPDACSLTLRTFALDDGHGDYSYAQNVNDHSVQGPKDAGYFDIPSDTPYVSAVLGLKNSRGNFGPIAHASTIALPQNTLTKVPEKSETCLENNTLMPNSETTLDEGQVIKNVLETLKLANKIPEASSKQKTSSNPIVSHENNPLEAQNTSREPKTNQDKHHDPDTKNPSNRNINYNSKIQGGASSIDNLASNWQQSTLGSGSPIALRASLLMRGTLAPKMQLVIGNKKIKPLPGGRFSFRHDFNSFSEIWSILLQNLPEDVNDPQPLLELAKTSDLSKPLIETHAYLEIEGQINDPQYRKYLPSAISVDKNGRFQITRPLSQGAVILPNLLLIS